jgi:galactofuranose transport system substrate-binding protein
MTNDRSVIVVTACCAGPSGFVACGSRTIGRVKKRWMIVLLGLSVTTSGLCAPPTSDIEKVLEFEQRAQPFTKPREVAYLTQCVNNPYCKTGLEGVKAAAKKFNFNIKVFDAQFSPSEQLKDIQNAIAGNFDGFILAPTAAAQTCSMYKNFLKPTGKPVVVYDVPMCGDSTATAGVAGTILMQTQAYHDAIMDRAFASCKGRCEAAAVGGYVGTDLFNYWESALAKAQAKHPNVKLVVNQPTDFSPQTTARVIQDGLSAHPNINLIITPSDQMSRAAIQSVRNAGKTAGKDVAVFSVGGSIEGIKLVQSGDLQATTIVLPFEEAYYAGVVMVMALQGEPLNGYVDESKLPTITEGPGDVMLTKDNAARFSLHARY